jgi:ornithine cyclodeaminase/alanine dehydrogenase-like protein (mu-crystallin family)
MLSRTGSRIATVIGAGVQGREHVRLLLLIRDFERINVCSLRFEDAQKLAAQIEIARATADVEAAVRESDVVCLGLTLLRPSWKSLFRPYLPFDHTVRVPCRRVGQVRAKPTIILLRAFR